VHGITQLERFVNAVVKILQLLQCMSLMNLIKDGWHREKRIGLVHDGASAAAQDMRFHVYV